MPARGRPNSSCAVRRAGHLAWLGDRPRAWFGLFRGAATPLLRPTGFGFVERSGVRRRTPSRDTLGLSSPGGPAVSLSSSEELGRAPETRSDKSSVPAYLRK